MKYKTKELLLDNGSSPFAKWFNSLESVTASKVRIAISRMEQGNLSNVKYFHGIGEYRLHKPTKLRIYFAKDDQSNIILLIGGGGESRQQNDINEAIALFEDYKRRNAALKKGKWDMVPLTRDFRETVAERIKSDPVFAQALFDEAITLFVNGEADTAKSILCELAEATIGFEVIGEEIQRPNPTMSSISEIIAAIKHALKVEVHTQIVSAVWTKRALPCYQSRAEAAYE